MITGNGSEENGVCLRPCSSTSTTSSNNEEQAGTASASQYCPRHHHQHRHTPSPSKRHRLTPRPHNIQRPCLDFEKMQQVCLHFKTWIELGQTWVKCSKKVEYCAWTSYPKVENSMSFTTQISNSMKFEFDGLYFWELVLDKT